MFDLYRQGNNWSYTKNGTETKEKSLKVSLTVVIKYQGLQYSEEREIWIKFTINNTKLKNWQEKIK